MPNSTPDGGVGVGLDSMADLSALVRSGFNRWGGLGAVTAKTKGDLILFNYTPKAVADNRWNWFERVSRGLILERSSGKVVARPFDRFFNWGEGGRTTDAPIRSVTEKLDGSLGVAFMHSEAWHVTTRGAFGSSQARWATAWLRERMGDDLVTGSTLLFEIIYPENRVIVDYGDRAELVLLAVRDNRSGDYWSLSDVNDLARLFSFSRPAIYDFDDPEDIVRLCSTLDANQEGFVVEFEDGQRFKFKSDAYKELHRMVSGMTWKRAVEAVQSGTVDAVRAAVPDEFLTQFNAWVAEINRVVEGVTHGVECAFACAPKTDRRTFALWVQEHWKEHAPYLFAKWDGREYRSLIFRREFNGERGKDHDRQKDDETVGAAAVGIGNGI